MPMRQTVFFVCCAPLEDGRFVALIQELGLANIGATEDEAMSAVTDRAEVVVRERIQRGDCPKCGEVHAPADGEPVH